MQKGDLAILKVQKEQIKNKEIPPEEVKAILYNYYQELRSKIIQLPQGSGLFVMPSTSGKNIIPLYLSALIIKDRPDITSYNTADKLVTNEAIKERKIKDNYKEKIKDPTKFKIHDQATIFNSLQKEKNVFILDDIVSTGESAITLKRQLENRGVKIEGIVALKAQEKYLTRTSDMERLYKMILERADPILIQSKELQQHIFDNFAGYPRRKENLFENNFQKHTILSNPEFALKFLKSGSDHHKSLGISLHIKEVQKKSQEHKFHLKR
ncbi:MAG: phosphoribosyltransferase [Cyclobacteriaceae bacterium]|nr:phosphoribosyltransferase [Cyclobacteriaceae bacterium]